MRSSLKAWKGSVRSRSLWDAVGPGEETAPVLIAYCGITAALRQHVRSRTSGLAVLSVRDPESLDTYVQAGRLFLRQQFDNDAYDRTYVRAIRQQKNDRPTDLDIYRRAAEARTGILFCADFEHIDEELRLFADVVKNVPGPTERQINAALLRFGYRPSDADVRLIESESWTRLIYAFLPDRPIMAALRRLRSTHKTAPAATVPSAKEGMDLSNIHGLGEAQVWGLELAKDLEDFRAGIIEWGDIDSGLLVSGAPGTGKTMFAEALAKTCGLPLVSASAAQWQATGYLNDFLKAMKSAFDEARLKAPSILFIDEIDSFGNRAIRDSQNSDYKRQVINGLLELLDGFQRREGLIVVGATNHPENLDPAITRPGRLDKHVAIPLPDGLARCLIFEQCSGLNVPENELERFIQSTAGMSGASIKQVVRNAKRAARRVGGDLSIDHVLSATRPVASVPAETLGIVSAHEAGHAIVGAILGLPLQAITISDTVVTDGASMLGGAAFAHRPFAVMNREYYLSQLCMLLGGIAAETLLFKGFENSVIDNSSDLARATALATQIEACLGFGNTLAVEIVNENDLARLRWSDPELKLAVRKLLDDAFARATAILSENIDSLRVISAALVQHRYLSSSFVQGILTGRGENMSDAFVTARAPSVIPSGLPPTA